LKVKPEEHHGHSYLAHLYQTTSRLPESLEEEKKGLEGFLAGKARYFMAPKDLMAYHSRIAQLYLQFGERAKCQEEVDEALKIVPKAPGVTGTVARMLANAGDLDKALETAERAIEYCQEEIKAAGADIRNDTQVFIWDRGVMRRLNGDTKGAREDFDRLIADTGGMGPRKVKWSAMGHAGMALLYALPKDPKTRDLKKARESVEEARSIEPNWAPVKDANAVVSLLEGDTDTALYWFAQAKGAWSLEVRFYEGLAELRGGARDRAIELLVMAADVNSTYRKRIEEDPEFAPVRDAVLRMVKELGGKGSDDRLAVKRELESNPAKLAYIEGLVRTRRYAAAIDALDAFSKQSQSDAVHESVAERIKTIRTYAALHERLVKAIGGRAKGAKVKLAGDTEASVDSADIDSVELGTKGGTVKGPWAILSFDAYLQLLRAVSSSDDDWFTVGSLCFDNEKVAPGEESFSKCLAKGKSPNQSRIAAVVAAKRGIPVPQNGFVLYGGHLVTADEKDKLSKGLVLFRGQWVTKDDKQHLEKNHEKSGGKWIPLTETQLKDRGFVKYNGEWKTKEEVAVLRGEWTNAWTLETAHYEIKTNKSEACLKALGVALEDAYSAYGKFFGSAPPTDKKMKVLAFAKFEDYSAYCRKVDHLNELNATGFAPSEPWTLCGYDKFSDNTSFIETIVHEGCHLFYALAFPSAHAPSWLAEGMATNFEGFTLEAGHPKFTFLARERCGAAKEAVRRKLLPGLGEFFGGDAGTLIAKDPRGALTFYAEAWALFYFMNHTLDERYRKGFAAYMAKLNQGENADLKEALGSAFESLQQDFEEFIGGM
jgi:tetratricopeptide (TPR) repeat protein